MNDEWDVFSGGAEAVPIWELVDRIYNPPAPDPVAVQRARERRMDRRIEEAMAEARPRPPYKPPGPLQPIDYPPGCRCPFANSGKHVEVLDILYLS